MEGVGEIRGRSKKNAYIYDERGKFHSVRGID